MPIDSESFERAEREYSIENEVVQLLYDNQDRAYNACEITDEVMGAGLSERPLDDPLDADLDLGSVVDLTTVSTILDSLVDDGRLSRRIVERDGVSRSYYRARVPRSRD